MATVPLGSLSQWDSVLIRSTQPRTPEWATCASEFPIGLAKALSGLHCHLRLPHPVPLLASHVSEPLLSPCLQITLHSISVSASRKIQLTHWVSWKVTVMPPFYDHPKPKPAIGLTLTSKTRVIVLMFLNPKKTESMGTMCKGLESFSGRPSLLGEPRGIQQFPMAVYKMGGLK